MSAHAAIVARRKALAERGIVTHTQPFITSNKEPVMLVRRLAAPSPGLVPRPLEEVVQPGEYDLIDQQPTTGQPSPAPAPNAGPKLAAIAKVLGVDPNDEQAMRDAFEGLFAPVEAARAYARANMSPREAAMCTAKNIDPAKYAAVRAGIRARSATRRH